MTKVYVAMLEDSEGCGTIEDRFSVHSTRAGAEAAFRKMFAGEHGRFEDAPDPFAMTIEQIEEYLEDEYGHTGGVREEELQP